MKTRSSVQYAKTNSETVVFYYRHIKVHTGEKTFTCVVCEQKFSYNNSLNLYNIMRPHTGENSFKCGLCSSGDPEGQGPLGP